MAETGAEARIALAIDTSNANNALELAVLAQRVGAKTLKLGLELSSATSWKDCAKLAEMCKMNWVADAKLDDIPNTVAGTVRNLGRLAHPPLAITMHVNAGMDAMRAAQQEAGDDIMMLGVTELTSIPPYETFEKYGIPRAEFVNRRVHEALEAGLRGVVASPMEVSAVKRDRETSGLFTMIPGTRSAGVDHGDQANVRTPAEAITDGADLLVIGRQIYAAQNPEIAFQSLIQEIEGVL